MAEHHITLKPGHIKREHPLILNRSFTNHSTVVNKNWRSMSINQRFQRCVVKGSYTKNLVSTSWVAHGLYLQREHAKNKKEEVGLGFSVNDEQVNLSEQLKKWQEGGDPYLFKFIIAPENGHQVDLRKFTRQLVSIISQDLSHNLKWAAIDHHDTDHKHVHLLVSGRDMDGKIIRIEKEYFKSGIRQRCNEILTNQLGLRTDISIVQARERQVDKNYFTSIDQRLIHHSKDDMVDFSIPAKIHLITRQKRLQEIARLQYLTVLGFSEQISHKKWKIDANLSQVLKKMQHDHDIIKNQVHSTKDNCRVIDNGQLLTPLIGRVMKMEKQWLFIDNVDGFVYKVFVDRNILKWREKGIIKNSDLISLNKSMFLTNKGDEKNIIKVTKYKSLEHFLKKAEEQLIIAYKAGIQIQKNKTKREFAKSCVNAWIEYSRNQKLSVSWDK